MRVYELARELTRESKEILEVAHGLDIDVKTASSSLEESDADLVRLAVSEQSGVEEDAEEGDGAAPEDDSTGADDQATDSHADELEPEVVEEVRVATVDGSTTVADFAEQLGLSAADIVNELIPRGSPTAANELMPADLAEEIGEQFGALVEISLEPEPDYALADRPVYDDDESDLEPRSPVVTVMGHVDHGKTTLLDAIRSSNVTEGEAGGITQHIGAYQVDVGARHVTFIDTPGHEAFTSLRARGANSTDIVVLVVAAEDGVMPQTVEAISHSLAAGVKLVVAINKMDLEGADPSAVRAQLTEYNIVTEELGGDIPTVELSATTGDGLDHLLEIIDLIAQLEDFRANPTPAASGVIVESQMEQGVGALATVIVQRGTLRQGDSLVAGASSGRVRAMMDHTGERLKEAIPSTPIQIMGWDDLPNAGEYFEVMGNDKEARAVAAERQAVLRDSEVSLPTAKERLANLLEQLKDADAELSLIVKADAHGSLEALKDSIAKIGREGGKITIGHAAVGGITENDVNLAEVMNSVIVGFNVRPDTKARRLAEEKGIQILTYRVIYELLDTVEGMLVSQLAPEEVEQVVGNAEVRAIFKVPRMGTVAGCFVTEGEITRSAQLRLVRDGVVVHEGRVGSLRRFKDDVQSVSAGFECGVGIDGYQDIKEGDVIEAFVVREVART